MTDRTSTTEAWRPQAAPLALDGVRHFQRMMLWLFVFSGFFVFKEPAPYDVLFAPVAVLFVVAGLRVHYVLIPMIALLMLYNFGGVLSVAPYTDDSAKRMFTIVSIYLAVTAVFFAGAMLEDTEARLRAIKSAYVWAAMAASLSAVIGYFDVAGLGQYLTLYGRASGTFKDPNVLGPFLVPALVFIADDILVWRRAVAPRAVAAMLIALALLLAFSRGAWVNAALAAMLFAFLSFLTTPSARLRGRIVFWSAVGGFVLAGMVLVALSISSIRELFEVRASLGQAYDVGTTGRFGNQLRSIPLLLDSWNGLGPLRFGEMFGQAPHNTYVNAFSSYGWLGGVSYITLTLTTWAVGAWRALTPSPLQPLIIAIYAPFMAVSLQSVQIDVDHWRHFYLLFGVLWGLCAASVVAGAKGQTRALSRDGRAAV